MKCNIETICTVLLSFQLVTLLAQDAPPLAKTPFDGEQAKVIQQQWAKHLGKPVVETNSIGMQLAFIPPGEFLMGTSEEDMRQELEQLKGSEWYKGTASGRSIETPQHLVRITQPFYLGATEVTVGQFRQFVEATGYKTEAERGLVYGNPSKATNLRTWRKHLFKQTDKHPVLHLCLRDCREFCKWLSEKEGREYVVPTEAQWEYACRAGTTSLWNFAGPEDYDKLVDQYAWMSWDLRQPRGPKPVGERKPNAWGLYDMHGNVWEYVSDWYHEFYYKESPLNDPAGPETFNEMRDGRVMIRGGSFDWADYGARAAIRMRIRQDSNQHPHMGFRVALKIKDAKGAPPLVDTTPAVRKDSDPQTVKAVDPAKAQAAAVSEKLPKELTVPVADGVAIEFVLIPAGEFLMGDADGLRDERPLHKVSITRPFYMGKFEVTQGQWAALFPEDDRLANWKKNARTQVWVGSDKPMSFLDWNDCRNFLEALHEKAPGYRFSLPTEAQWEYACRAGSRTEYSFGDDIAQLAKYATFCALDAAPFREREPADLTVGHRKPNAWGLYDMHGGLWEWTADWYGRDSYRESPVENPRGPDDGLMRVLRGGSYFRYGKYARSAFRLAGHPDGSSSDYGMRVVLTFSDDAKANPQSELQGPVEDAGEASERAVGDGEAPPLSKLPFDEEAARRLQRQWAEHLGQSVVETNSLGMKMVLVPPGEFRQGASERELDSISREIQEETSVDAGMKKWSIDHIVPNEGPDHLVRVTKPYRIAAHEVTVGQFRSFVEATGYKTDAEREEIDPASGRIRRTWKANPEFKNQQDDEPVLDVSWHDAMALCRWLGKKEGRIYRMPTEAEWEYAARAGSASRWCFGDDRKLLDQYAWYSGNSGGKPHPVGTKKPNAFGLHDMHGNMWEYTSDFFADQDFEQKFGPKAPVDVDPTGIRWGYRTCLRGGSFDFYWFFQRATSRVGGAGRYQHHHHMGFRLAMVIGDDGPSQTPQVSLSGRRAPSANPAAEPPVRLVKHDANPVLEIETNGVECRSSFSITRMDDVFYLWHAAQPPGLDRMISADGVHWSYPGPKPSRGLGSLFEIGFPMQWDDSEIAMPYALRVRDYKLQRDVLMMYYAGAGKDGTAGMGYASFLIGAPGRWYRQGLNPLLRGPIFHPCVVQVGETFVLWCVQTVDGKSRICQATSPDGVRWTPISRKPVLPLGKAGEFDSHSHNMPRVLQMGRELHMWYLGNDGKATRLGLAVSTDGVNWKKVPTNPVLDIGGADAWDGGSIVAHDVQWHNDGYHVWFAAMPTGNPGTDNDGHTMRIGYATARPAAKAANTTPAKSASTKSETAKPAENKSVENKPAAAQTASPGKGRPKTDNKTPLLAKVPFSADQAGEFQKRWAERIDRPLVYTNSIGMKLTLLPPGEFMMGMTQQQADEMARVMNADERLRQWAGQKITWAQLMMPSHRVRLTKPFYMGSTEVTVAQYRKFVEETGYVTGPEAKIKEGTARPWEKYTWDKPLRQPPHEDKPVVQVTWNDCVAFCNWLSKKEGVEYRLPTEAEWEYACRAGTTTLWSFGDFEEFDRDAGQYMLIAKSEEEVKKGQRRVGLGKANPFGLYDMHGNVWEFVGDYWHRLTYKESPLNDPTGPAVQSEKGDSRRIIRGGSFDFGGINTASPYRMRIAQDSFGHHHCSFRVVMTINDAEGVPPAVDSELEQRRKTLDPGADSPAVTSALKGGAPHDDLPKELTIDMGEGVNMPFVLIPPGSFLMGSTKGAKDEMPVHRVVISKPFYMAKYELTQSQWQAVMGKVERFEEYGKHDNELTGPNKAMNDISWNDCQKFIAAFDRKTTASIQGKKHPLDELPGHRFALPTEAQWEYACRAGSAAEFYFGEDASKMGEYAYFEGNMNWPGKPGFKGKAFYHDVGLKKPNSFGLYDMHGGVWEWCSDWYSPDYYFDSPLVDPQGPKSGRARVLRGGSWFRYPKYARSAYRRPFDPAVSSDGVTAYVVDFGCRLVINLDANHAREDEAPAEPTPPGAASNNPAPIDFTKLGRSLVRRSDKPVITVGAKGAWDDQTLGCFTVLDDGRRFYFYSGGAQFGKPKNIGMATSKDGIHWTEGDQNPLFPGGMPYAIKVGDTFRLYHPGKDDAGRQGLLMRTSPDGFRWSAPQLVLKGGFLDPCVVQVAEDRFHLYYCGGGQVVRNGKQVWEFKTHMATSPDGITWTKLPEPALPLGPEGSWDASSHAGPVVLRLGEGFHMWYLGSGEYNGKVAWRIGHATSPDGLNWKKSGDTPVLDVGKPGAWDGGTFMSFDIVYRDGKLMFWYAADPGEHGDESKMRIQVGYGTSQPVDPQSASTTDHPPLAIAPFNARQAGEFQQQWAERLGRPRVLTNSIGMKLVLLPPGEFRMGLSEQDTYDRLCSNMRKSGNKLENNQPEHGGLLTEMPAHRVRLTKPFYMGQCEVTVSQFRQFADATGYKTDAERGLVYDKPYEGERPIRTWRKPAYPDRPSSQQAPRDDDPVMHLDWNDCMAFCKWLSKKEAGQGVEYSLPASAEWEYACRAGTTTVWYFGDDEAFDKVGQEYEWISWRGKSPRAVGQGKPNPFGLYDMHGNMMEWMADWLHDYYYLESPLNDPLGPDNMSEERNKRRMVRGGAFEVGKYWSRSSWYVRIAQGSNQHRHPGFRVVMHIRDVEGVAPAPEPELQIVGEDKTPTDPVAAQQAAVAVDRPRELQIRLNESVSMEFVLAPAGSFLMGSRNGGRFERPVHQVNLTRPFYIGKYEVTQQQYDAVMGEQDRLKRWGEYGPIRYRPRLVGPDKPMHHLNWNDWQDFIAAIRKKVADRDFRLPTEAQWEYACRAGTTTEYCFGDDPSHLDEYASFCAEDAPRWSERDIPDFRVGQRKPNNWGVYDMHGNVREWCSDWWNKDYYSKSPLADPQGPEQGNFRVLRGGTIKNYARFGRSAFRFFMLPDLEQWNKSHMSGARLVINLPAPDASDPE